MKPTIYVTALAASALVAFDARTVTAQTAAAAPQPSATAAPAAATIPWSAHPSGRYELEIVFPDKVMPATVVIADSSGVPSAVIQTEGDPDEHAMKVTVKGTELYLNAVAPKGAVELVLLRSADQISGRWTFGEGRGTLRGHVEKK
jgi:hypothetical protein